METVTFRINKSVGYTGKGAAKTYIARIQGTCKTYIFRRDFLDTEATDPQEMFTARRRGKGSWSEAVAVEAGLYEVNAGCDGRTYRMVYRKDGVMVWFKISAERATEMALLMDGGASYDEARLATKPAPAVVAQ
jgi:hypothetical protein